MKQTAPGPWRATELRRRVENRRQETLAATKCEPHSDEDATESDVSNGERLPAATSPNRSKRCQLSSGSLPTLLGAKHELYEIQGDVFASDAKQVAAIRCADQHFTVERNMRRLGSDLAAVQSSVRLKSNRLRDLHKRVLHLTHLLHDTAEDKTFARSKVIANNKLRVDHVTTRKCPRCHRTFMMALIDTHVTNCTGRKAIALPDVPQQQSNQNQVDDDSRLHLAEVKPIVVAEIQSPPKFISQPPRNLRIAPNGITHNVIVFEWDQPIFTGSHPVVDYELQFATYHSKRQLDGTVSRLTESRTSLRLSHWCQTRPVPPNRFCLTHVSADQEYGDICIAAITKNGKSAFSNRLDIVKTAPAAPPSSPLYLAAGVVTAKTITLFWSPPMDDGGKPLQDYEVSFVEAVMEETATFDKNILDVSDVVYKSRLIRTYSTELTFTLTGLLSGKEHKEFQVRAVNSAGIPGAYSQPISSIFTIAPGNEFRLLDELQAAVNARTRVVDSQFLSGFMQRYERQHYIGLVSRFIISMHPKLESKVNAILERTEPPSAGGQVEHLDTATPITRRKRFEELTEEEAVAERRRQFHFRIAEIEKELKRVANNVQWCKDRRIDLVSLIRVAENRITEKQAELERARMFKGPQMDSDVLESGLQRFYTKDLVVALEDEIEIEQLYIVDTKAEIVKTENYLRADEKCLAMLQQRLEGRREALVRFDIEPAAFTAEDTDSRLSSVARLRDRVLYRSFAALVQHRDECREEKRKIRAALLCIVTCKLRSAMRHWRQITRLLACFDAGSGLYGVGSTGLLNASSERGELASDARASLQEIRHTDNQLQALSWSSDQTEAFEDFRLDAFKDQKFYPFWVEADAKMDVMDYDGAGRLYEFIEGNANWTDRMSMRLISRLQQRIGLARLRMGNHEKALVWFHRASAIAGRPGETGEKQEEGFALAYIAEVQFTLGSFRQSVDHFEQALLCFEAVGDPRGQLSCYRGLERVFAKLEDTEMMSQNKNLADEIEFSLQNKLVEAGERLLRLQQQLVGIGAESSTEIDLERVKAVVPRLRRERIKCKYRVREEIKWTASLEKLLREKTTALSQGEVDLKRALASDSTQVDSAVLSGTNARYETEDFKRKLAKLMGIFKAAEDHITKEILNSVVRVRNAEDEIKELESELCVETGALMRRMLAKEPIRCFRFNATNEALKNVIGTASHGVTTCVASAALNGLLFDLLSGACLSQGVGDPHKDHLGEPTGHQAPIVSLFYIGNRIYTGSMDAVVGIWDVKDELIGGSSCVLKRLLTDFDSAVMSIHADSQWLACSSSDCDVFLYDSESLILLARVISAHNQTTTALFVESFKSTFITGGADHRVKVWEVCAAPTSSLIVRRRVRLVHTLEAERRGDEYFNGHLHPVSCVRQIATEVVSADTGGRVVIWNLDAADRKVLRICDVHKCAVTCLQFDATKIVSGGADGNICVTDFATGNLVQTLVGHEAKLLDLQFDRKRLLSMSANGKIRLWYWQTRIGVGADQKKYHILGAGETLKSLSLKYRTSIDKLLKWNNLSDSCMMYLGQKLVVEIDMTSATYDELQTLDMKGSTQFGKLAYENLDFLAANKAKSEDVEEQWAAQRVAQLAKEYFPPITAGDGQGSTNKDENEDDKEDEEDSDDDSAMTVNSEQGEGFGGNNADGEQPLSQSIGDVDT